MHGSTRRRGDMSKTCELDWMLIMRGEEAEGRREK